MTIYTYRDIIEYANDTVDTVNFGSQTDYIARLKVYDIQVYPGDLPRLLKFFCNKEAVRVEFLFREMSIKIYLIDSKSQYLDIFYKYLG